MITLNQEVAEELQEKCAMQPLPDEVHLTVIDESEPDLGWHRALIWHYITGKTCGLTVVKHVVGSRQVRQYTPDAYLCFETAEARDEYVHWHSDLGSLSILPGLESSNRDTSVPLFGVKFVLPVGETFTCSRAYIIGWEQLEKIKILVNNAKGKYYWHDNFIFFDKESDAAQFKLRFNENRIS